MRLLGLTSIGLTTYLQSGFRISYFGLFSPQRLGETTSLLSDSLSFFTFYFLGNLSTTLFSFLFLYLQPNISGKIMIALEVSAIGGPISLIISGCLGGSGLGTGSHIRRPVWR